MAGFVSKFYLFLTVFQQGLVWLVLIAVLNTAVAGAAETRTGPASTKQAIIKVVSKEMRISFLPGVETATNYHRAIRR